MKKYFILKALLVVSCFSSLFAQSVPDPEFSGSPYILAEDNSLKNLEKTEAQVDVKVKIIGGNDTYFTISSPKSNLRFSKGALPKLIMKVDGNVDPSDITSLYVAEIKKNQRKFLQGSMGGVYKKARDVSKLSVKLEFKKIRDGIYEIILPSDIQSGEYGFIPSSVSTSTNSKIKIMCFGID